MFDATITLGTLIQTIVIAGSIIIYIVSMRGKVNSLVEDITDIKADLKSLNILTAQLAVNDSRISAAERDIRDLKHGKGFISNPLPDVIR